MALSPTSSRTSSSSSTPADGWVDDSSAAWTYASATTFTTPTDLTTKYSKGTRIKLTQTTVKYFVVVASSFGGGNTTVTITGGSDYTLVNAAISANYYSYTANPQGYPRWFAYSPNATGFSSSSNVTMFQVTSGFCSVNFYISGTSNTSGFGFDLPVTPDVNGGGTSYIVQAMDNGVYTGIAIGRITANSVTVGLNRTGDAVTTWTTSGTKRAFGSFVYPI